jgi:integrase
MFRRMTSERYLTDDQLARFMTVVRERHHVNQPRDYALFALLANTGIRPGEALALTVADAFPHERPAWIRVKRLKKRKAVPEWDDIEIGDDLALVLARHVDSLPITPSQRVFHMNRRSTQRVFKVYARRAKIQANLYVLRHTAATRLYVATRDIEMVQAMLGHENRDTSTIYAHIPHQLLLETVNTMPVFV